MAIKNTYRDNTEDQSRQIRRLANNSIIAIWIAGICCMLIFATYFFILPSKAEAIKAAANTNANNEALFTDKTALVNIGLKMQSIPETAEVRSMGNFRINKIIYEKNYNIPQRVTKPVKTVKPDFSIKAVPK